MNGKPLRMMTDAELWGLGRKPDTADVAFLRAYPRPDGRGQYQTNDRITMEYSTALTLMSQGVLTIVKSHFDRAQLG